MNFQYYDLNEARGYIGVVTKTNSKSSPGKTSLSRLFKTIRKHFKFEAFGDYPILSICLEELCKHNDSITPDQIKNALKYSVEYKHLLKKDKMKWYKLLDQQMKGPADASKFFGSRLNEKLKRLETSKRHLGAT